MRSGAAIIALVLAASAALFAIGVAREISGGDERFLYWGLTDGGLLFSFVFIEKEWGWWTPPLLRQLGEASFAIYLSNQFTLAIATKALQATGLGPVLGLAGSQVLLVVSALAAGLLVNVVAERPMQAFATARRRAVAAGGDAEVRGNRSLSRARVQPSAWMVYRGRFTTMRLSLNTAASGIARARLRLLDSRYSSLPWRLLMSAGTQALSGVRGANGFSCAGLAFATIT